MIMSIPIKFKISNKIFYSKEKYKNNCSYGESLHIIDPHLADGGQECEIQVNQNITEPNLNVLLVVSFFLNFFIKIYC